MVSGNSGMSTEISQGASQPNDFAILHTSYIVNHDGGSSGDVSTATRNDVIIYNSPNNYIWAGLDRLIWSGKQTPNAATAAQHVARYAQAIRATIGSDLTGKSLPQPQIWAACLEYRDTTGQASSKSNASLTVEMDWFGNGADDAANRQVQSVVVGQNDLNGAPVEVSSVIGVYLAGGHAGSVGTVFNACIPFSRAVLDTSSAKQLSGATAIRLAAGHAIAFEPTGNYKLWYDGGTGTLKWTQGGLTFPVGKGITVGFQGVYGSNATILWVPERQHHFPRRGWQLHHNPAAGQHGSGRNRLHLLCSGKRRGNDCAFRQRCHRQRTGQPAPPRQTSRRV